MAEVDRKIFLVTGNDEFAVKTKSRAIITSLCGENFEENPALEIIHGDSDEKESPAKLVGSILEAIATPPFLAGEKVVWVKNFSFDTITGKPPSSGRRRKQENDASADEVFERLVETIKAGLPDGVRMLMGIFNMDRRSAFYKACAKAAELHEFEKLGTDTRNLPEILSRHIASSCAEMGMTVTRDAENFLIEACGASHSRIINELEKISAFIHPRTEASLQDCLQICSMTPEMASWAFSEAVGRRDLPAAMRALDILITPKNPEIRIIYSLIGLFSDMAQIRAVSDEVGLGKCYRYPDFDQKLKSVPQEIREKYSWSAIFSMNPYRAFKIHEQASKIPPHKFAEAFQEILRTNKALVSGAANPRLELENLAVKLCT